MAVWGRLKWVVVGVLMVGILTVLSGFHRIPVTRFELGPTIVRVPFGPNPNAVGQASGIDGRVYGPLTFATNGTVTVVSDTYRERVLIFHNGQMTEVPTIGQLVEDVAVTPAGRVVLADNRGLALWLMVHGRQRKLVQFPSQPGYTDAIWHIGLSASRRIYVELVRFGHGTFSVGLDEYAINGQFIRRIADATGGRGQSLSPLSTSVITDPIRNFQVVPGGDLAVEPSGLGGRTRTIHVYGPGGHLVRSILVPLPEPVKQTEFLGVSDRGWIYLGINLTVPHHAVILVANAEGHIVAHIKVPADTVYAANYGRVLPSGTVYLEESTKNIYKIQSYVPHAMKVWHWTGF